MDTERHSLDTREPGTGSHASCKILEPGVSLEAEDSIGFTVCHIYLDAKQALAFLAWLTEQKPMLEQFAAQE